LNKLGDSAFFIGYDSESTGDPFYRGMVADVYSEAYHLFSFTHTTPYYLISHYDASKQRIWIVPFHGQYTKVWVLQFDPAAVRVSYYKEFEFDVAGDFKFFSSDG